MADLQSPAFPHYNPIMACSIKPTMLTFAAHENHAFNLKNIV
jgi:hypothetical protein